MTALQPYAGNAPQSGRKNLVFTCVLSISLVRDSFPGMPMRMLRAIHR